jgi:nitroreductase
VNDTINLLLSRKSVRSYESTPVKRDDLELIVRCGIQAPTGRGLQPWHFTVIENRDVLNEITDMNKYVLSRLPENFMSKCAKDPAYDFFYGAPCAVIVSGANEETITVADCSGAVENMIIAAESLGLSTCYLASFKISLLTNEGKPLLDKLKIPKGYAPLFAISLGYGKDIPESVGERNANVVTYIGN